MSHPSVIEPDLPPAGMAMLRRLLRSLGGDDPRGAELAALRTSVDELGDELAALRLALDARKIEILDLAATDPGWRVIAEAAWPDEVPA